MTSAASSLQGQGLSGTLSGSVPLDVARRRAGRRRQMLLVQAASCSLVTLVLLVYCYTGTISIALASVYFLVGMTLI